MRKLIECLETGKQKEAKKFIKKIMEELDRWNFFTTIFNGKFIIINIFKTQSGQITKDSLCAALEHSYQLSNCFGNSMGGKQEGWLPRKEHTHINNANLVIDTCCKLWDKSHIWNLN